MKFINKIFNSLLCAIISFGLLLFFAGEATAIKGSIFFFVVAFIVFMIMDIIYYNEKKNIFYLIIIGSVSWMLLSILIDIIISRIVYSSPATPFIIIISLLIGLFIACYIVYLLRKSITSKGGEE